MAVNNFIKIARDQSAAIEADEFLQFIDTLRRAYEMGTRIRAKMRHTFSDGGGADLINWTTMQTLWGVPSNGTDVGTSANGQTVFTFVDGSIGSMEGAFQTSAAKDITESVG